MIVCKEIQFTFCASILFPRAAARAHDELNARANPLKESSRSLY